jgi:hypothetical protein
MARRLGYLAGRWSMGEPSDGMGELVSFVLALITISLTSWRSSADYMQGIRMSFKTKEDAVHFAEKQGEHHRFRLLHHLLICTLMH